MKANNLWKVYFVVFLLSVAVIAFSSAVFINTAKEDHNTLDNLIAFVASIFSILIALLAYHISVKTYVSIDAVNAISRMDGNVMESENYRTEILSLMRQFDGEDRSAACNQLLSYLNANFKKESLNSGARLADSIQGMIDLIVLFSFVIKRGRAKHIDSQVTRIEKLIATIEVRVAEFESLSEGSCILLRESVKLLKAVYNHQCYLSGHHPVNAQTTILDVRGAMLKNAISRTIYFNYMGLFFLSKAMEVITSCIAERSGERLEALSIEAAPLLRSLPNSKSKDLAILYLREASDYFDKAACSASDELLWSVFIQYNTARTQYLLSLLGLHDNDLWQTSIQKAVESRIKLVALLDDILGINRNAYFQRAFADQLKMAQLMQMRLLIASGVRFAPDTMLPDIGTDEFNRLKTIFEDVSKHIK